jgi:hypothetical protein
MQQTIRTLLLSCLTIVLVACAQPAATSSAPNDVNTPDAAHAAWVEALKRSDQQQVEALLAMTPAEARAMEAGRILADVNDRRAIPAGSPTWPGAFQSVEVRSVHQPEDALANGYSLWRYEQAEICYRTELRLLDGAWRVAGWYRTVQDAAQCEQ